MSTDPRPIAPPDPRLLRGGLAFNALLSSVCAIALLTRSADLSVAVGLPQSELVAIGASLVGFVALLLWQAQRRLPHLLAALLTSLADIGWVVASLVFLAVGEPSLAGQELVGGVALGVGLAATVQLLGLRQLLREPDPTRKTQHRYVWWTRSQASPEELWPVLSDLGSIQRYSAGLASSAVRAGPNRAGAVRDCTSTSGDAWSERVIGWDEGRAIDLEFLAEAPGFPFPMKRMLGGWRLDPTDGGSRVLVYWSFDLHRPGLAWLTVPLLGFQIERTFPAVIEAMAGAPPVDPPHAARARQDAAF